MDPTDYLDRIKTVKNLFTNQHKMKQKLKKYQLPFEWDNQIEGLCVESDSTLLLVLREVSGLYGEDEDYTGIYRFNVNTKKTTIAVKLKLDHEVGLSGICLSKTKEYLYVLSHRRSNELITTNVMTYRKSNGLMKI